MIPEGGADIIGHSMIEKDVKVFYTQPWVMVASDGGIDAEHPRGAGTFTKVLGRYVREKHWFSLPEAIRKMTSLPATRMKLADRGRIERRHEGRPRPLRPEDGHRQFDFREAQGAFDRHPPRLRQRRGGLAGRQDAGRAAGARDRRTGRDGRGGRRSGGQPPDRGRRSDLRRAREAVRRSGGRRRQGEDRRPADGERGSRGRHRDGGRLQEARRVGRAGRPRAQGRRLRTPPSASSTA